MRDLWAANKTNIVLIHKVAYRKYVVDYPPIGLYNVLYKVLSKTLVNMLKVVLPNLILENQSALIPQRLITDNALVAFEIFHCMKRKTKGNNGEMVVKLDISKAYDRVGWTFLDAIMTKLGFCRKWIDMILSCILSVTSLFVIIGVVCSDVTPTKGLRQGIPFHLMYLFYVLRCSYHCYIKLCRKVTFKGLQRQEGDLEFLTYFLLMIASFLQERISGKAQLLLTLLAFMRELQVRRLNYLNLRFLLVRMCNYR